MVTELEPPQLAVVSSCDKNGLVFSFRDDDDINDVASMAGVNLSEESARILATNSELVGTLTRSCKDDTFLLPAPLQRRILEIGTFAPQWPHVSNVLCDPDETHYSLVWAQPWWLPGGWQVERQSVTTCCPASVALDCTEQ